MAPVNDEKRLDMHLETASLQAVVLFLLVLFKLVNGAILFPDDSKGVCTQRIRYVVGYNSIEAWLFSARRDEENRISSRSFIATQNVPYKESYRSYTWGIFWTTKYRWNNRKEVKRFVKFPSFDKIDSIELFFYPVLHVCTPACVNGQCMPNNYCKCDHGYESYIGNECLPYCSNCEHGKCIAPDVCQCDFGYQMNKNGVCEPVCAQDCEKQHAYCSSPNTCTCNFGYQTVNRVRIVYHHEI